MLECTRPKSPRRFKSTTWYKYKLVTSLTFYIYLLNARVEELRRHKRWQ